MNHVCLLETWFLLFFTFSFRRLLRLDAVYIVYRVGEEHRLE